MSDCRWIALVALLSCACSSAPRTDLASGGTGGASGTDACAACSVDADCASGSRCAILTGESFCLRTCPQGHECVAGRACLLESSTAGDAIMVCVPQVECGQPPAGDAGPPPGEGGGGGGTGTGGTGGGQDAGAVSPLLFAVVGDTRGALPLSLSYPTAVITQIYTTIQGLHPRPPFVISTGDYAFEIASDTSQQLGFYLGARKNYSGAFYPAMGNHECTWLTMSNCGPGTVNGMTPQYTAFLNKLVIPMGQTLPYYAKRVDASHGSWSAKFVFIAANAWTAGQGAWLDAELAKPTTYTFIVRHEPSSAIAAPGVVPSDAIIAKHPYTLIIVGHIHTYSHTGRQVMFGNGGAPKSGTKGWGFGLFRRRADGAIQVEARDYVTAAVDPGFTFAVHANGSPAP